MYFIVQRSEHLLRLIKYQENVELKLEDTEKNKIQRQQL